MTIIYNEAGDGSIEDLFAESRATFLRARRVVERLCNDFEDGTLEDIDAFKQSYGFFKSLVPQIMSERERLEREHAKRLGIADGHSHAIDFDAARQEIGRRLACLAAAGDPEGISG